MTLLDFARGPALYLSLFIFVLGTGWRLLHLWRRPRMPDLSPAREGMPSNAVAARKAIVRGMWPRRVFGQAALVTTYNGYIFHIGLAVVFLGYAPHIAFIQRITWLSWPALPDVVMYFAAAATIMSLLFALYWRLTDAVLQRISNSNDWITWTVTFLPMITGMAVVNESSVITVAREQVIYPTPLAIHLLSLELLLIWFPFGKLMHAILFAFSRGSTGIRFNHRGVEL